MTDPLNDYLQVCAVLDGNREPCEDDGDGELYGAVSKVVSFLLRDVGADVEFNREHFLVRYPDFRQPREYDTSLAAPALKILLERSGVAKVAEKASARLAGKFAEKRAECRRRDKFIATGKEKRLKLRTDDTCQT